MPKPAFFPTFDLVLLVLLEFVWVKAFHTS